MRIVSSEKIRPYEIDVKLVIDSELPPSISTEGLPEALSLLQEPAYGIAKTRTGPWRTERGYFITGETVVGSYQALIRELPLLGGGLVWINRGPCLQADPRADSVKNVLALLRERHARHGFYLRIAPPWQVGDVSEEVFRAAGFQPTSTPGWASAIVDLTVEESVLRAALNRKWRNHLSAAERSGTTVVSGDGDQELAAFLDGHERDLAKKGYATTLSSDFLRALQGASPKDRRLIFFLARDAAGAPLGGVAIARYGHTTEYFAGHNNEAGRRIGAGQLLLWRAMTGMRDAGYKKMDLGGMDPDSTPAGIYKFKSLVGGKPYRFINEFEAINRDWRARVVRWYAARARNVT